MHVEEARKGKWLNVMQTTRAFWPKTFSLFPSFIVTVTVSINHQQHFHLEWPSTAVLCHWQGGQFYTANPWSSCHPSSCENKNIYNGHPGILALVGGLYYTPNPWSHHYSSDIGKLMSKWSLLDIGRGSIQLIQQPPLVVSSTIRCGVSITSLVTVIDEYIASESGIMSRLKHEGSPALPTRTNFQKSLKRPFNPRTLPSFGKIYCTFVGTHSNTFFSN